MFKAQIILLAPGYAMGAAFLIRGRQNQPWQRGFDGAYSRWGGSITVHDYPAPRVIPRRSSSNSEHGEQTGGKPWQSFPSSESFSTLAIAHPCPGCTEPFI